MMTPQQYLASSITPGYADVLIFVDHIVIFWPHGRAVAGVKLRVGPFVELSIWKRSGRYPRDSFCGSDPKRLG
jgi:hypothetical protein